MGKSESGPDGQDCLMFLRQLETTHECSTSVLITVGGSSIAPVGFLSVLSVPMSRPPWHATAGLTSSLRWPSATHKSLEAALYALLCQHDHHLTTQRNKLLGWR